MTLSSFGGFRGSITKLMTSLLFQPSALKAVSSKSTMSSSVSAFILANIFMRCASRGAGKSSDLVDTLGDTEMADRNQVTNDASRGFVSSDCLHE